MVRGNEGDDVSREGRDRFGCKDDGYFICELLPLAFMS